MTTYPAGRFDTLELLSSLLPSFWTDLYGGQELLVDYLRGSAAQERQLDQLANELYDAQDRLHCPALHTELWHPVELREDEGFPASVPEHGGGTVFGEQPEGDTLAYGMPVDTSWGFPVDPTLRECHVLADAVVEPAVLAVRGVDFHLDPTAHHLIFHRDPFLDARFTPYEGDDGVRCVRVYLLRAGLDRRYVQQQFGNAAGVTAAASSENYKRLVNALLDASAAGVSPRQLHDALAAITDIPLAAGGETVEDVALDASGLLVITDQNVYRFAAAATALVTAGDVLVAGQALTDGLRVHHLRGGRIPGGLAELTVGTDFLWAGAPGPVTFTDAEEPLTVVGEVDGFTKVTFPLGGDEEDVAAFFDELHRRGVVAGAALANHLDVRASPSGQPTAASLPATINPLEFLLANVLRSSAVIVELDSAQMGPNNLGTVALSSLRTLTPPHTGLLVNVA